MACSRHVYEHGTRHVHGMRNVWASAAPPPLSDTSCFEDGNPGRVGDDGFTPLNPEGCPPFSPPAPTTPPPSLPPIVRQRQLRSDEAPTSDEGPSSDARLMLSSSGNGHYSGGKVQMCAHALCVCAHIHMHAHAYRPACLLAK